MPQAPHSPLVLRREWPLQDLLPCSRSSFHLVAAGLCVKRQWTTFKPWKPCLWKQRTTEEGDQGQSEWQGPHISGHPHTSLSLPVQTLHSYVQLCVCAGEGVPASGRFPLAFLYNVPTTAGRCSTHLLRVPLLVYVMLTDLLLFGIWCTKAMKHGHPGRDRLPMRDTLKCSRINITSKTKLSIVLTFSPEVSGRWPLWPYPQFSTIHDTLYYFIKLYNRNKSFIDNAFSLIFKTFIWN